jgi:SRSO17 transposase
MDADAIVGLRRKLGRFLNLFSQCGCDEVSAHIGTYVEGQLSELERKNVEHIALNAGVAPRTLQEFLANYDWDHDAMRDQVAKIIAAEHSGAMNIGIIDETSFVKKGTKTPGVQRQHCGAVGKHENCNVTVHLSFASKDFHCLVDGDLFLPESWSNDRERCRAAKIPDDIVYRPKSEIALELYERALGNGLHFDWLTFDEWYTSKPAFLDALQHNNQKYIGETHRRHMIWASPPRTTDRPYTKNGGRLKTPRLASGSPKSLPLGEYVDNDSAIVNQKWTRWHLKDTQKGPKVVEVKHTIIYPQNSQKLPSKAHHLLVVRDVMTSEIKLFISNAPKKTRVETLLKVAFSRWRVERCFEDDKKYVGLDHFEGRGYPGLMRHLILSAVSLLFLARERESLLGDYPELTVSQVRQAASAMIQSWWLPPQAAEELINHTAYKIQYYQKRNRQARQSHTKTRLRKLQDMGIDLTKARRCQWDSD